MTNRQDSNRPPVIDYPAKASMRVYRDRFPVPTLLTMLFFTLGMTLPLTELNWYVNHERRTIENSGFEFIRTSLQSVSSAELVFGILVLLLPISLLLCCAVLDALPSILLIPAVQKQGLKIAGRITAAITFLIGTGAIAATFLMLATYKGPIGEFYTPGIGALFMPLAFVSVLIREWKTPKYKKQR